MHPFPAGGPHTRSERFLIDQLKDRIPKRCDIPGGHENAGFAIAHGLGQPPGIEADNCHARGGSLERCNTKSLSQRRMRKNIETRS